MTETTKPKYEFTEDASPFPGLIRLRWEKNGRADPLDFCDVEPFHLDEMKARVRTGELD